MQTLDLIHIDTFCANYKVDLSLVHSFAQFGLLAFEEQSEGVFIPAEEIPQLEKMIRLHQELEINVAGIDVVLHLLARIEGLQMENLALQSRLMLYEGD